MTISTTTIKNSYSGDNSTSVFTYTFKITDQDDIEVLIRSANGTETTKTITTHYTISGVGNAGGGNVTFTAGNIPTSTETVVLRRNTPQTQGLDLIENDPLPANSLEDALDKLTAINQELQEENDRSIKLSRTNTMTSTEFTVDAATRANKILAFDSAGEISVTQELGTYKGNWAASTSYYARDIVKDTSTNNIFIANTAHTSSGSQPLTTNTDSAKWDLLVDAASATSSASAAATSATNAANSATAAATSASNASTSESNAATSASTASTQATNAATSATNASNSATAAANSASAAEAYADNFDDAYLGAKASDPTLDNDGDALADGALYFDTTNNVMKVYDLGTTTWYQLTPTVSNQTNINTVAAISSEVQTVASDSTDIQTVAADSADIRTLADIEDGTSATNAVSNAGNNATNITTVAGQISPTNNISTVAGISSNISTVAGISSSVTQTATDSADIQTVATNLSGTDTIGTVATNIANVNSVGGSIANVNTVATNISDVNSFAETYFISATAPSSPTEGDLWFDTATDTMKVYNGSSWQNAGSSVNGTSQRYKYTATASQTTFTGADDNANTLAYDAGYIDVYLNGVHLDPSDYTATNGTSIVLGSAAALNDELYIVAFGTFSVANIDGSAITSGTINNARLTGSGQITINGTGVALGGSITVGETKPTISSISPDTITNAQTSITITGTNFASVPQVEFLNPSTGIWYVADTVTFNSSTSLTVQATLTVDATYKIRIENPDGNAVLSSTNILTVSDAPTWTTAAGSLGSVAQGDSISFTVAATSDSAVTYSVTSGALPTGASLNSSSGAITGTEAGSDTGDTTYNFTITATDAESQTAARAFSITVTVGINNGATFN